MVDRINDIQFLDTDKEFAKHINEQAKEAGLLPASIASKFYEQNEFAQFGSGGSRMSGKRKGFICIKVLKFALLNLS